MIRVTNVWKLVNSTGASSGTLCAVEIHLYLPKGKDRMNLVRAAIPYAKNMSQRLKQIVAALFPSMVKKEYFGELEKTLLHFSKPSGRFENEIAFVQYWLPEQAIVFDIGANRGDYIFVFERSQKTARIHAFEPIPELASQLKKLFPEVSVHQIALSDNVGLKELHIPYIRNRYFDTRGSLERVSETDQTGTRKIEVKIDTLDLFCKAKAIQKVDFIKIDVEGHESSVLRGAMDVLKVFRPMLMVEIEQRHHEDIPIAEIVTWVEELGYSTYFYLAKENRFEPFSSFVPDQHQRLDEMNDKTMYINNFLFVPQERRNTILSSFTEIVDKVRSII